MKECKTCKQTKSLEEFSKWHGGKTQPVCKDCNRIYQKQHYGKNKGRYITNVINKRKNIEDEIRKIKMSTPCKDCGKIYHYCVMDFDHLIDKKFQISKATRSGWPLAIILAEIEKCELVCANCHRLRSFERRLLI